MDEEKNIKPTGQGEFGTPRTGTCSSGAGLLGSSSCNVPTPLASNQAGVYSKATGRNLERMLGDVAGSPIETVSTSKSPENTPDPFKKSTVINRSPRRSASEGEIFYSPVIFDTPQNKRKRQEEGSAGRPPAKSTCVEDTLLTVERMVARLCKSVGDSSNTKKEIRDISAALRNLVSRMLLERERSVPSRETDQITALGVTISTEARKSTTQAETPLQGTSEKPLTDKNPEKNESEPEKKGPSQLQDASTQTDEPQKSRLHRIAGIHEILNKGNNREELVQVLINDWPGETYVKTETKKEDILVQVQQKNTVVILEVPPEDETATEKDIRIPQQLQPLIQGKQMKSGDIIRVKSSAVLLTEENLEREHHVHTLVVGIGGSKDKRKITEETLKVLSKLFETIPDPFLKEKDCTYLFGTPHQNLETPMRKALEYFGHKTDTKFTLNVSRDRKKKHIARTTSLQETVGVNDAASKNDKWEVQRTKKTKMKTMAITPSEPNLSYAGWNA